MVKSEYIWFPPNWTHCWMPCAKPYFSNERGNWRKVVRIYMYTGKASATCLLDKRHPFRGGIATNILQAKSRLWERSLGLVIGDL